MGRETVTGSSTELLILRSQGVELAKSLLTGLLFEDTITVGFVPLLLLLLQASPILLHLGNLLGVEQVVVLTYSKRRWGVERVGIWPADVKTIEKRRELVLGVHEIGAKHLRTVGRERILPH